MTDTATPDTDMQAVVRVRASDEEVEITSMPVPEIDSDELLLRVEAVGVGIHDTYFLPEGISFPFAIGIEAAGIVERVGADVDDWKPGDRISCVSAMQPKGGTWATFAAVKSSGLILRIPDGMSFTQAAAIPVAGGTALRALMQLPFDDGATIFIAGASGAVGSFLIQLAVERGWRVAASASTKNHEYMRSLGASMVVDYNDDDWHQQVLDWMPGGVDAAIAIQPNTSRPSMQVVRQGATVVSISAEPDFEDDHARVIGLPYGVTVSPELERMMKNIVAKQMQLEIGRVFEFDEAEEAMETVRTRHARGKYVLQMS